LDLPLADADFLFCPARALLCGAAPGERRPGAPGGMPPRFSSLIAQYSHAREKTLGCWYIVFAISISPRVKMPRGPIGPFRFAALWYSALRQE
jgi:hypothetical protein